MIDALEQLEPAAQYVLTAALNGMWQGAVLALLAAGLLRYWRRCDAATRYAVWGIALLAVLCLPVLAGWPAEEGEMHPNKTIGQWSTTRVREIAPDVGRESGRTEITYGESDLRTEFALPDWRIQVPAGPWSMSLLALWALAAFILEVRVLRAYRYLRRLKRDSRDLPAPYQQRLHYWSRKCGLRRRVRLCSSPDVCTPVAVGLAHPAILIPAPMVRELEWEELDQVYLHELAHIKRWDDWANLLQKAVEALFWPFVAVWWIGRRLDLEREIACDDWVVDQTGKSRSYALCLTRLLELSAGRRLPVLAAGAVQRKRHICTRIELLLDRKYRAMARFSAGKFAFAATVLLLSTALLNACGNPFAPDIREPVYRDAKVPVEAATTPEQLMDNLHRAMNEGNRLIYESLLDENFWFTEFNCLGELVTANDREEELAFIGSRDGSVGIFDRFRTFEFEFRDAKRYTELGRDYPEAFPNDPDGHAQEDWEVFRGRVQMRMLDASGDGFIVDQVMTFKLRQDGDDLWKIIRWDDDPLTGCGAAKQSAEFSTWVQIKTEGR